MEKPSVRVVREIFPDDGSREEYRHSVAPGEFGVDVSYFENDVLKTHISIELESAEAFASAILAFASAILACAKEMREAAK